MMLMQQMTMVVNKCNYKYKVYSCTAACSDIDLVSSSSARSPKLSDGVRWRIRITKESEEKGAGNCAGFKAEEITGVQFQNGLVYKIVIGE